MNNNYFNQLNTELEEFKTQDIKIADSFTCNQRKITHDNIRAYNSQFENGNIDSEGFLKFYYNITRNPCNSASKAIRFEPKDIILNPAPGQSSHKVWLMNLDLRHYFKVKKFNQFLQRIFKELPIMGSVVVKKIGDEFYFVDLRNLANEQSAETLKQATYVIEQHYYSINELRKQPWKNIDKVIEQHRHTKAKYIKVLERYGEVPESLVKKDGDENKFVYARVISYSPDTSYYPGGQKALGTDISEAKGEILDARQLDIDKEFPYREFHFEKMPGRWLGISRVEVLRDPQIRTNEIVNLRVKSSYFAALNIFQSRDDTFKKNLLKDIVNGQVVSVMDRIEKIPTEERNLASFDLEERKWLANRDETTFSYDVVRGERMPAGTPLGSAQLAAAMIASYFEQIQQNIAADIKELIYNDIIPSFKNQPDHYIKLIGEDLERYYKAVLDHKLNIEILEFNKRTKRIPTKVQAEAMKQILQEKKKKEDISIPKSFYKDVKYVVDIIITGQDKDLRVQASNMAMVLQSIQQDQTLLTDPAKRKIFGKLLESVGLDINDIAMNETQPVTQMVQEQKGGGISRPNLPTNIQMPLTQSNEI